MPMVGGRLVGRCPRCGAFGSSMSLCARCAAELQRERDKDLFKLDSPRILPIKPLKKLDPLDPLRR